MKNKYQEGSQEVEHGKAKHKSTTETVAPVNVLSMERSLCEVSQSMLLQV